MRTEAIETNPEKLKPGDILISEEQIQQKIRGLAKELKEKYEGKRLLLVGILKGSYQLFSDLSTELHRQGLTDHEISFITLKSYGSGTEAEEEPRIVQDMDVNPIGRHVVLVDDIIDTGKSSRVVKKLVESREAASVETLALLDKPERRKVVFEADYVGFRIKNIWVQGYGMDTAEMGRGDPNIRVGPYDYPKPPSQPAGLVGVFSDS